MFSALLPSADDLHEWASRVVATQELPRLVRRLIASTVEPTWLEAPAGTSVRFPGPDLVLRVPVANPWVPGGDSLWEMGTGADPEDKADSDYDKRTAQVPEAVRHATTFVFVTPRRWQERAAWMAEKQGRNQWADVRAIDANGLETWLEQALDVHLWLSHQINGRVGDPRALENWWREWSDRSHPHPIPPGLVLTGRERQRETLLGWLDADPNAHTLRAPDVEEAVAFIAAALIGPDPDTDARLMRAVVVTRAEGWREVITVPRPLILIPIFPDAWTAEAVRRGHHVIVPVSPDEPLVPEVELLRIEDTDLTLAIRGLGIDPERADELVSAAAGSLLSLRRGLSRVEEFRRPPWSEPDVARLLVPAVLAGTWDSGHGGDRSILSTLAGRDYESFEGDLEALAVAPDPPVRRRGSVWFLSSNEDVWAIVAQYVSGDDWSAFVRLAVQVLGEPDPAWDLPPRDRWAAALHGKGPAHSPRLRRAVSDTVAMLGGWRGLRDLPGGRSGPQLAAVIVRQILDGINDDRSGARWAAISDGLARLAEAAPDLFLAAIGPAVAGDEPIVVALMNDAEAGGMFGRAAHTSILWALETLAWSQDYLEPVAQLLADWTAKDPGGRLANRPVASLRGVFLSWYPQTSADVHQRLAVLDGLRRRSPGASWPLLLDLIPRPDQIATQTARPRWRPWAPIGEIRVSRADVALAARTIVAWLIEDAGNHASRWAQIVEVLPDLPDEFDEAILDSLAHLRTEEVPIGELEELNSKLRTVVGHHRAYADAEWAMPPARVDKLAAVADRFRPTDPVAEHRWLFHGHPDMALVVGKDYEKYDDALADLRRQALSHVRAAGGWDRIAELADSAETPETVGWTAAHLEDADDESGLRWVTASSPRLQRAAHGFIRGRRLVKGWAWAADAIASAETWSPAERARALFAASETEEAWRLAAELGRDVEAAYWAAYTGFPIGEAKVGAARKLLEFGRPFEAIDLLGAQRDLKEGPFDAELAFAALVASMRSPGPSHGSGLVSFEHHLANLLNALEASGFPEDGIAAVEWFYLPLLERGKRPPRLLEKRLATDAAFFVEVVSAAFRRAKGEPAATDEGAQEVAANAYRLLSRWKTPPGRVAGGMDEEGLRRWVTQARNLLAEVDRLAIGDQRIGHVLWYSPPGADGLKPHEAIRNLLEELSNEDVESGYAIEAFNSRGVYRRSMTEPGKEETALAEGFEADAARIEPRWARTSALLKGIAEGYRAAAKREADEAAVLLHDEQQHEATRRKS